MSRGEVILRAYEEEGDREAVLRIWREVGWLGEGKESAADAFVGAGRAWVAQVGPGSGQADCVVTTVPGEIRYLESDLPFSGITGVTTSRVARKRGMASRLTARAVAADAADGALVAGLGVFEQGFYDQLGFGSGGYEITFTLDPAQLALGAPTRVPRRIGADESEMIHACRLARFRGHGGCNLTPAGITRYELEVSPNGFGLGYCDDPGGQLTHHLWCTAKDVESGPYNILWVAWQSPEQFLELMRLVGSLGDQIRAVRIREPQGIQLQDLLDRPFRHRGISSGSRHASKATATAYWQMRICDLPGCLERTRLPGGPVRFNLDLTDPIERLLDEHSAWHGVGGRYVVTLGDESDAREGTDPALPVLAASVGAFTRLWLGVRPASGLAVTDDLAGPAGLLARLDSVLALPDPKPDWDF